MAKKSLAPLRAMLTETTKRFTIFYISFVAVGIVCYGLPYYVVRHQWPAYINLIFFVKVLMGLALYCFSFVLIQMLHYKIFGKWFNLTYSGMWLSLERDVSFAQSLIATIVSLIVGSVLVVLVFQGGG